MTEFRQPVHTVFGGAQLFHAGVVGRFQAVALQSLATYAPDAATLRAVFGFASDELASAVLERVHEKLVREPIEDYRVDFEDGYGVRPEAEEDGHAVAAAREVAAGVEARTLPWRIGIRVKAPDDAGRARSARTLHLFLSTLIDESGAMLENFVITVPKITHTAQVEEFARSLAALEREFGLAEGALRFEVMIETPQIVLGADGRSPLALLAAAGGERLTAAIFGAYDFTAALGITAAHQSLRHPACDFARNMMLVALSGTPIRLSDGATAILPVAAHSEREGIALTAAQREENRRTVHAGWRVHHDNIRHAMANGFYQGWDLHPAQLVSRYATSFAFFIEGMDGAAGRLEIFSQSPRKRPAWGPRSTTRRRAGDS